MRNFATILSLALITAATGCNVSINGNPLTATKGSGIAVTDIRDVAEFTRIKVTGSADVDVTFGDEPSLEVEVDDNLVESITTEVDDGELTIGSEGSYSTSLGVKVRITMLALESVSVSGSGSVNVDDLKGDSFEVSVSGSGDVKVDGKVTRVTANVAGSGDVDLTELQAVEVDASIAGSGDIDVTASEKVTASIAGSGDISYDGHSGAEPKVESQIVGSGDIDKR